VKAFAAGLLATYGDPAARPRLDAALDACAVDTEGGLLANDAIIELKWAIERLGGTPSTEHVQKFEAARTAMRAATAPVQMSAQDKLQLAGNDGLRPPGRDAVDPLAHQALAEPAGQLELW